MNRARVAWIALALVGLVAAGVLGARAAAGEMAAVFPGDPLLAGKPFEGSRLFSQMGCIRCHAIQGVGGTTGPDLSRGILNRPLLEIAGVMWNHSPGMEHVFQEKRVARPTFEPAEMASLLSFLYYLGSLDAPGDPLAGARIFRQRECGACHAVGGTGGRIGPPLDRFSRYASPLYLTAALWNGGRKMAAAMTEQGIARPTFEPNDIPDLLAYIRAAGSETERSYATPGDPKRGEALFESKRCIACHAVRAHGGTVGPDLGLRLKGSLMRIAGSMWNHGPSMWSKMADQGIAPPQLDADEMSDLVSYLYFFQLVDPPGDPARGEAVYAEKGCGACHGATQEGTGVAPSLADRATTLATPLAVITAMWNHAGQMEERLAEANVAWPILHGGEMADLIAYLLSSHERSAAVGRPASGS